MPPPAILAAGASGIGAGEALSAGGNIASQIMQNVFAGKSARKAYHRQKKLFDHQFNKYADYNDPSAQMERLAKAGLNPNLIYGQSSQGATGSAQGSTTGVQKANYRTSNPVQDIALYQNLKLGRAQEANVYADERLKNSQAQEVLHRINLQRSQIALNSALKTRNYSQAKSISDMLAHDISYRKAQTRTENLRGTGQSIDNAFQAYTFGKRAKNIQLQVKKAMADIDNVIQNTKNQKAQTAWAKMRNDQYKTDHIHPGDNFLYRVAGKTLSTAMKAIVEQIKKDPGAVTDIYNSKGFLGKILRSFIQSNL